MDKERYGWICPQCNKSNAPWVEQCSCYTTFMPWIPPYQPWAIEPERPDRIWEITWYDDNFTTDKTG